MRGKEEFLKEKEELLRLREAGVAEKSQPLLLSPKMPNLNTKPPAQSMRQWS